MAKMKIKKGDTVKLLAGKDYAKKNPGEMITGKVIAVIPSERKVIVEGRNMVTCHTKPRRPGETGGIVRREAPMYASKVQVLCPKCSKPTRVGYKQEQRTVAGKEKTVNVRICKHCGAEL